MAPQLPEGLSVSSLIGAKGAELKFWSVKTNELAERKVLNISGTNEVLRGNLATYYGLDLTVNPRTATITTPTISEDIRDQWKEKVKAGIPFKLLTQDKQPESQQSPFPHPIVSTNSEIQASQTQTTATPSIQISSSKAAVASTAASVQREFSLERCEGLPAIIQQIESGAVQAIRDRYGPSKPGQRGTADASWPKYSNLVSKRERLHRILTQDFEGDKGRFLAYFSVSPPATKKRKRAANDATPSDEHFRSLKRCHGAKPISQPNVARSSTWMRMGSFPKLFGATGGRR
ncbi:hypothetical protein DFH06DRAFT_1130189 [Mycena polygramma]|nr:hypothetical protein DFH06DRAFT_1130189 [Mycena polygramma]